MKIILAILMLAGHAQALVTQTPNMGLYVISTGTLNWGPYLNSNATIIDSSAAIVSKANTFTSSQTFTAATLLSSASIGGMWISTITCANTYRWASDGNGNMVCTPPSVSVTKEFFLTSFSTDAATNFTLMLATPTLEAVSTKTYTVNNGASVSVSTYITVVGYPGLTSIPGGNYELNYRADSNRSGTVTSKLYIYHLNGSSNTLVSFPGTVINQTIPTNWNSTAANQPSTATLMTDRLMLTRTFTCNTAPSCTINFYKGGAYYSDLDIPAIAASQAVYMPNTGATVNVYNPNISATFGPVVVSSLNVTGSNGTYGMTVSSNVSLAGVLYTAGGKVLIGENSTTASNISLDVVSASTGDIIRVGAVSPVIAGRIGVEQTGALGALYLGYGSAPSHLVLQSGGNVGIGTTAPLEKLSILGVSGSSATVNIQHSALNVEGEPIRLSRTDSRLRFHSITAQHSISGSANWIGFKVHPGGDSGTDPQVEVMRLTGSGNVGITNTSPAYKLDVTGGIHATSTVTASAYYGDGSNLTGIGRVFIASTTVAVSTQNVNWTVACDTNTYSFCELKTDILFLTAPTAQQEAVSVSINDTNCVVNAGSSLLTTSGFGVDETEARITATVEIRASGKRTWQTTSGGIYTSKISGVDSWTLVYGGATITPKYETGSIAAINICSAIGDNISVGSVFKLYGVK